MADLMGNTEYIEEPYWTCPQCEYTAQTEREKQVHLWNSANDPMHRRFIPGEGL